MAGIGDWVRGFACVLVLLGCGREAIAERSACDDLSAGDLVITEVHANPDGSDADGEYIEFFNATKAPLTLDGLTISTSRTDGVGPKSHRFIGGLVEAERYIAVGNAPIESMPAYLQYSYGASLGPLRNSDATLLLRCGEMLLDQVRYERTVDGRALEFDGRLAPDHELNDDEHHWCAAPTGISEISEGNFGTPGTRNSPCAFETEMEGLCLEEGSSRTIRAPDPGEVRITEWMANPEGPDADFEWVEALFEVETDLNGLELGPAPDALKLVIDQEDCFPVDAGARVVFGASPAAAPRVDAELSFSLGNSAPRAIVAAFGEVVLDRVDYDGTVEGVAWQIDVNDQVCGARSGDEYLDGNFGTPGELNRLCPPVLGPGMCLDAGTPRSIVHPSPGDVAISEWMANPSSVGNREGEWIELRFSVAVDLNGLVLSDLASGATTVEAEDCLRVDAGTHIVFARNANPLENGGVESVDAVLSLSLNNNDEAIELSVEGRVLDSVTYARSEPGVATQVDDFGLICTATRSYGDGDLGTPGSANPRCV